MSTVETLLVITIAAALLWSMGAVAWLVHHHVVASIRWHRTVRDDLDDLRADFEERHRTED